MNTKRIYTIIMMIVLLSSTMSAQVYINYFYVKGDVCLPVRVKHSQGEFYVYENGERHDGALSYVEAWDCEGRHIISPVLANDGYSTDKNIPIVRNYTFEYLYPEETEGESDYYSESSTDNSSGYTNWMDRISNSVERGRHRYDPAYSNITFQVGLSRVHGEFIRAKACLGGQTGFIVYGGIGHDWIFNPQNEKFIGPDANKLAWHAGLGFYGGDLNGVTATGEFALMIDYAQTPMVENGSLNLLLEGTWYFGASGHFGAFGGLGFSLGDFKKEKPKANFIFEVGLAYRFY